MGARWLTKRWGRSPPTYAKGAGKTARGEVDSGLGQSCKYYAILLEQADGIALAGRHTEKYEDDKRLRGSSKSSNPSES